MRFLLDVHIASSIANALERHGHDVLRAAVGHADWSDARLLELAVRDGRILVTEDRDFSDLIYRDGAAPPPSTIYLRFDPAEQSTMADRVLMVLANVGFEDHIVVIRPSGLRLRPFPKQENEDG